METTKQFVITVNRELGSGGRTIGRKIAERLGVKYYDKALVEELTRHFNIPVEELEKIKGSKRTWWDNLVDEYTNSYSLPTLLDIEPVVPTTPNVFRIESRFLKELASEESCVMAGRSGFYVCRDMPNTIHIFIQSTIEKRVQRVMEKQNLTEKEAREAIERVDKGREIYTRETANISRYDTRNYDIVLNVANLTEDEAVDLIMNYIEINFKRKGILK